MTRSSTRKKYKHKTQKKFDPPQRKAAKEKKQPLQPPWQPCPYEIITTQLPPLPDSLRSPSGRWMRTNDGGLAFHGSASLFKRYARIGDAVLEGALPRMLCQRYELNWVPTRLARSLVRNTVLSHLAVAYKLHLGRNPVEGKSQHQAADAFEAIVAAFEPEEVKCWLMSLFGEHVFPHLGEELATIMDMSEPDDTQPRYNPVKSFGTCFTWKRPKRVTIC